MLRKIIKIDAQRCNGCGLCAAACHEGAIGMVDGVAKLLRDDYCDGLGDCLPVCPTDAISFEIREAAAYNEAEVKKNMEERKQQTDPLPCGCPGTHAKAISRAAATQQEVAAPSIAPMSELAQWPVQIQLVPIHAPYFHNAHLLVAADCTAYAYANFHSRFMRNKVTLIGCPKLDHADYAEKLTAIIAGNEIKSVTVVRMEVPCCGGIEQAVKLALQAAGKMIPWQVVTVATDGTLLD